MFRAQRYRSLGTQNELLPILSQSEDEDLPQRRLKKWPYIYWLILKLLCLFHGRKVVSTRICHKCRLTRLQCTRDANTGLLPNFLYPSAVASPAGWHDDDDSSPLRDENVNLVLEDEQDEDCEVCLSNWWDADGHHSEYKEDEIGELF